MFFELKIKQQTELMRVEKTPFWNSKES